ncbi:MAG: putative dinucleotide-binding enzyme [Woeseiaceae bacterium]|jgi:predicted dinucleotide-binding enzyme
MTNRPISQILARAILFAALLFPTILLADTIAIIGTGAVAGALGPEFAAQGHTIVYGSRDPLRDDVTELVARTGNAASATTPTDAAAAASIVVLAVPGELVDSITRNLGDLADKIIIDPTNPLHQTADGYFEMAVDTSNGEIIQAAAPGAHVVKAFNALNWRTMVNPESSGGPVSIPLVGDNAEAKARVAELVEGMGLEAIDLGPIRYARHVEGMLILWINNRYSGHGVPFDYHLRKTE